MEKRGAKLIILSGGGTGGSVTPLLAVAQYLTKHEPGKYNFLFLGTKTGPEKELVMKEGIEFKVMLGGKLRRYFSWRNFSDILIIILAFWQSLWLVAKYRPALIISAGSFVSVPLVWAGKIMGAKSIIHQQDFRAGLANKIMAEAATVITVALEKSVSDYPTKAVWIGNPIKEISASDLALWQSEVMAKYNLPKEKKIILIMGGGTGSAFINTLGAESQSELAQLGQVVHLCGAHKAFSAISGYLTLEMIPHHELLALESLAEVIVSRCGLGSLTEIAYFQKPALLIPLANTHQEDNANYFAKQEAAVLKSEAELSPDLFVQSLRKLLEDQGLRRKLANNLTFIMKSGATQSLARLIDGLIK